MIIWRIDRLRAQLRDRALTSREVLPYAAVAIAMVVFLYVLEDWDRPWDRDVFEAGVDSGTTVVNGLVCVFGLWACHRANGASTGADFLGRVVALGAVLLVRFAAFAFVLFALWVVLATWLRILLASYEDFDFVSVVVTVLFWWRLRLNVSMVAIPVI